MTERELGRSGLKVSAVTTALAHREGRMMKRSQLALAVAIAAGIGAMTLAGDDAPNKAIDDNPAKTLKAGDTFYEPTGCLHWVSRNAGKTKTRVLAVLLVPHDAKGLSIPEEPAKEGREGPGDPRLAARKKP